MDFASARIVSSLPREGGVTEPELVSDAGGCAAGYLDVHAAAIACKSCSPFFTIIAQEREALVDNFSR